MKISLNQLRRIIKEETLRVLTESPDMDQTSTNWKDKSLIT